MPSPAGGLIRPHSSKFAVLNRIIDSVIIVVVLDMCERFFHIDWHLQYEIAEAWAVIFFLIVAETRGVYHSWRVESYRREFTNLLWVWFVVVCALIIFAFLTKTSSDFSRRVILTWVFITPMMLILFRMALKVLLRTLRMSGRNLRTLAFAGAGDTAHKINQSMKQSPWVGMQVVGVYDNQQIESKNDLSFKGDLTELVADVRAGKIDFVYITLPMQAEGLMTKLINDLSDTTASVFVIPDIFVFELTHARWTTVHGIPAVSVFESPFYGVDGWLKRAEDVVLSCAILALIILPMLLIALAVQLTSSGPAIFRQRRYGLNGDVISVWKFRSMSVCEDGDHIPQATQQDARVTPLGAFLRRTSLDELPQFFNVLQGSMSIVGPRPHAIAHNEMYRALIPGYMLRHKVKPGITGLAQINGWRGKTDTLEKMEKRVEFDLMYMRNWSLGLDLKIIGLTILRGFSGKNAY